MSNGSGKCPVMHGGITKAGESNTSRLWPNSINLEYPTSARYQNKSTARF